MLGIELAIAMVRFKIEEQKRFEALCKKFPEKAETLRAERKKRQDEELQHQRNLEVAREGRSLNFWGNR